MSMTMMTAIQATLFASILALFVFGNVHASNTGYGYGNHVRQNSIFDVLSRDSRFDTLEKALERTGLDAVLDDKDLVYTLLAPTDGVSTNCDQQTHPWLVLVDSI